jgi:hypothetical protein
MPAKSPPSVAGMRGAKKLGFGRELGFADKKVKYFVFFDDWVTLNRSCALKYI